LWQPTATGGVRNGFSPSVFRDTRRQHCQLFDFQINLDFWPSELWEITFLLFLTTEFLVICYSSHRKLIPMNLGFCNHWKNHTTGRIPDLISLLLTSCDRTYSQMGSLLFNILLTQLYPFGQGLSISPLNWAFFHCFSQTFVTVTKPEEKKQLGGSNYLSWLIVSEVSVHSVCLCGFGTVVRQNIMVATACGRGYLPHGRQEADRQRECVSYLFPLILFNPSRPQACWIMSLILF
jgi:hypothetical protein